MRPRVWVAIYVGLLAMTCLLAFPPVVLNGQQEHVYVVAIFGYERHWCDYVNWPRLAVEIMSIAILTVLAFLWLGRKPNGQSV